MTTTTLASPPVAAAAAANDEAHTSPLLSMTIGQMSRATGLSADTLRYYERLSLLAPRRDTGRRRHYGPQDLLALRFVAKMRATDMPLAGIRDYLALSAEGDHTAEARRALLAAHGERIRARLRASAEALELIEYKLQHFDELSRKMAIVTAGGAGCTVRRQPAEAAA